jgi:hypothetical protein
MGGIGNRGNSDGLPKFSTSIFRIVPGLSAVFQNSHLSNVQIICPFEISTLLCEHKYASTSNNMSIYADSKHNLHSALQNVSIFKKSQCGK